MLSAVKKTVSFNDNLFIDNAPIGSKWKENSCAVDSLTICLVCIFAEMNEDERCIFKRSLASELYADVFADIDSSKPRQFSSITDKLRDLIYDPNVYSPLKRGEYLSVIAVFNKVFRETWPPRHAMEWSLEEIFTCPCSVDESVRNRSISVYNINVNVDCMRDNEIEEGVIRHFYDRIHPHRCSKCNNAATFKKRNILNHPLRNKVTLVNPVGGSREYTFNVMFMNEHIIL